jgi:hypothetical protein
MRDLSSDIKTLNAISPVAISSNTTTNGLIIDRSGFESLTFILRASSYTDGDYLPLVEEGDQANLSDAAEVADVSLIGTEAGSILSEEKVAKIGYNGYKRYIRISFVSSSTTTGATLDAIAILGHSRDNPLA